MGAIVGLIGGMAGLPVRAATGAVGTILLIVLPHVRRLRVIQINRETSQALLELGPIRWGIFNGALLGAGFTSRLGTWLWYVVPMTCFVVGAPLAGAVIWGVYAVTRLVIAMGIAAWMRADPAPDAMARISTRLLTTPQSTTSRVNALFSIAMIYLLLRIGLGEQ